MVIRCGWILGGWGDDVTSCLAWRLGLEAIMTCHSKTPVQGTRVMMVVYSVRRHSLDRLSMIKRKKRGIFGLLVVPLQDKNCP